MPMRLQRGCALLLILVLSPTIAILALLVRISTQGPAFHRAVRHRPGGTFVLYKLRTMRMGAAGDGPGITANHDPRITRLGRILRKSKLDELPQLWNVVRGDMALVGPRPEDPRYVDLSDPLQARVFAAIPGITGPTALLYRDEESILAAAAVQVALSRARETATTEDLDRAYREIVLPAKLAIDDKYLHERSAVGDLVILIATLRAIIGRAPSDR